MGGDQKNDMSKWFYLNICDVLTVPPLRAQFSERVLDWIGIVLSLYIET